MNKLLELLPSLLLKTRQKKLDWQALPGLSFVVEIGNAIIEIQQSSYSWDRTTTITARDSSAQILETVTLPITDGLGQEAAALFDAVRHQVFKVDETLDEIGRSLDLL